MRPVLVAVVAMIALLGTSYAASNECPCGSDSNDPYSEHDQTFLGSHVLDDECVCRCGDGPPYVIARDKPCAEYSGACDDADGVRSLLVCE